MEADTGPVVAAGGPWWRRFRLGRDGMGGPSLRFHALLCAPVVLFVWSASVPGMALLPLVIGLLLMLVLTVAWIGWGVLWLFARERAGHWRWVLLPVLMVLTLASMQSDLWLRARFAQSRAAFERVARVHSAPLGTYDGWASIDVPDRVGSYSIRNAAQVGRNLWLHEESGGRCLDDAGFAYLPAGPDPQFENGSFENPEYVSLGGDWYAFTASW